jgi:hypothetical protein
MFEAGIVEEIKTRFFCSIICFSENVVCDIMWKRGRSRQATDGKTARHGENAICMPDK